MVGVTMHHDGVPEWAQTGKIVYIRDFSFGNQKIQKATVARHTKTQVTVEVAGVTKPRRFKVDNWSQDRLFELGFSDSWRSPSTLVTQEQGEKFLAQIAEQERRDKIARDAVVAARKVADTSHGYSGRMHQPSVEHMHAAIDAMQIAIREFREEQAKAAEDHARWLKEMEERERNNQQ